MNGETLRGMQHCTESRKKKKEDKPYFLSLNMKPIKPVRLWIQNKKNGEQV